MSDLKAAGTVHGASDVAAVVGQRAWRTWIAITLSAGLSATALLWVAVVLIDPYSSGRFALTQRIDLATENARLADAGLVRDQQFDGAIFGDSTAVAIDPRVVAQGTGWSIAQLAFPASVENMLTIAAAFERFHPDRPTLEIFTLRDRWCETAVLSSPLPFPGWLYDPDNRPYLARILSTDAVETAFLRLRIWLGIARPKVRADGYRPLMLVPAPANLFQTLRPAGGPSPDQPFPSIDLLAAHVAGLAANRSVLFVFVPSYVSLLPVAGSTAERRLAACKQRVRQIAASRPGTGYLDLLTENPATTLIDNFVDPVHFNIKAAPQVAAAISRTIVDQKVGPQ